MDGPKNCANTSIRFPVDFLSGNIRRIYSAQSMYLQFALPTNWIRGFFMCKSLPFVTKWVGVQYCFASDLPLKSSETSFKKSKDYLKMRFNAVTEFELESLYMAVYLFPSHQLARGPSIQNPSPTRWIGSSILSRVCTLCHIMRVNHNIRKRL